MRKKMKWLCGAVLALSLVLMFMPARTATAEETAPPKGGSVGSIAIDTKSLYISTTDGVFKSTDGGNSWIAVNDGLHKVTICLSIDPKDSQTVYAGTQRGIFKSTNGGSSWNWSDVNRGLPFTSVESLAIDPANSQIIYAGTYGDGVFKSVNGGDTWSAINNGVNNPYIISLVIDPVNSQNVYIVTGWGRF